MGPNRGRTRVEAGGESIQNRDFGRHALLRLIDETGQGGEAALPFPKAILASRLGMTSESLTRTLSALKEHDLETAGNQEIIRDRARLEAVARPDDLIDQSERSANT